MLNKYLDKTREPFFICIGTPRNILDSVAPRIGDRFKQLDVKYLGDSDNPVHGRNIDEHYNKTISKIDTSKYQIIAIDATISPKKDKIIIENKPCKPGKGLGKDMQPIGEVTIGINVLYKYPELIDNAYIAFFSDYIKNQEEYVEDLVDYFMLLYMSYELGKIYE